MSVEVMMVVDAPVMVVPTIGAAGGKLDGDRHRC